MPKSDCRRQKSHLTHSVISLSFLATVVHFSASWSSNIVKTKEPNKLYLTTSLGLGGGARLGNYLFAFASTYGLARHLQRIPYVTTDYKLMFLNILNLSFPNAQNFYQIINVSTINQTVITFGSALNSCDNMTKLKHLDNVTYVSISGTYLQCWRYFHAYRDNILTLFTFHSKNLNETNNMSTIFINDRNHKLCVHVRRGDFVKHGLYQFSTEKFTLLSVRFVRKHLLERKINSSVIMFGDDMKWMKSVFQDEKFVSVYILPLPTQPVVHMAVAAKHCQTFIITATSSSFGFWIAYLTNSMNVYYNLKRFTTKLRKIDMKGYVTESMLPNWIPLLHNETTDTIEVVEFGQ